MCNAGVIWGDMFEQQARLFACDCAERVLPIFESEYPNEHRPRQALATARRFAKNEATAKEVRASRVDAAVIVCREIGGGTIAETIEILAARTALGSIGWVTADGISARCIEGATEAARKAIELSVLAKTEDLSRAKDAANAERVWQKAQLQRYINDKT